MGYYTQHELAVLEGDHDLIDKLRDECEAAKYAIDGNGECEDTCKWYSHRDDLKKFSEKHPGALFRLDGEGEETGDIWVEYHKGGKMQYGKAKIILPEFSELLLK